MVNKLLKSAAAVLIAVLAMGAAAPDAAETRTPAVSAVALGESFGGVTDRAFVVGPPNHAFVIARAPGAFLDCGARVETRAHDAAGVGDIALDCGVTLSETVSVPRVGQRARLIVHY